MKKYSEILSTCALFKGIEWAELEKMLVCLNARTAKFAKRETVLAEGSPARQIGIVLSGAVQIEQVDYFGNRSLVGRAEQGELFSQLACADLAVLPVDVVAAADCEVMFVDRVNMLTQCASACAFHTRLVYNLMKVLAGKNLRFHAKIEAQSKRTTRGKLMAYLMRQAKEKGNCFEIPFDRQALADYLGVERSGLSAEIGKLVREGVIKCRRSRFEIL